MSSSSSILFPKSPISQFSFKPHNFSLNGAGICNLPNARGLLTLSFRICCKLKTTQGERESSDVTKKIVVSDRAPSLSEGAPVAGNGAGPAKSSAREGIVRLGLLKRLPRKVLAVLSNLPLAIGEMFVIAGLMALGMLASLCA